MTTLTKNNFQNFMLPLVDQSSAGLKKTRTSDGVRPTLGRKLELTWEGLRAAGVAGCPLCVCPSNRTSLLVETFCQVTY